ncbi:MAG: glutamate--tRNA ligase [bacterium]|nr:glutamate--tRNA ligase [bacterium]
MSNSKVRVRFAPSPTGFLHIGGLRTALYNHLFAQHKKGDFVLRIEDTDRVRTVEGGIENICQSLKETGVIPNEGIWIDEKGEIVERGTHGPYLQSKRQKRHHEYADELIRMGKAYPCFCTEERLQELRKKQQLEKQPTGYDGTCRNLEADEAKKRISNGVPHVIRLRFPEQGSVIIHDVIRGKVAFDWKEIDDQVIIKSDGMPTYHLAATCDDHDMEISHVLRGEEWLSSTPKHIFIYEAFNWELPIFVHLPLILNPDKSKLSKRQGDVGVNDYIEKGYLPEAIINFVALLGWNPKGDQEIYSHEELAELFDPAKINKAGGVFDTSKLNWMNNHYLRALSEDDYFKKVLPSFEGIDDDLAFLKRSALLVRDRLETTVEIKEVTAFLFRAGFDFQEIPLAWKDQDADSVKERLEAVREVLTNMEESNVLNIQIVENELKNLIEKNGWGNGDTLWPLRVALSGMKKSPGPFELVATYGKERALQRIDSAIKSL